MDLFDTHREHLEETSAPLAARMRPRTLDEFVGQTHIIGPGRLLRRAIQADQLSSLIFYGPPGTGKTTLARVIANTTKAHFISINAVLAGVKEIRGAIATAQEKRGLYSQRTLLFVDEVHRFNKSQQDALLPWVENGTVILIGATTENPYFEVNKALVSRSRIFQLKPLEPDDLYRVVEQALADPERGYGQLDVTIEPVAVDHLVNVANGDARALLNALELAVETTVRDEEGEIRITLEVAEESIQRRAVLYDKEGDAHFDTVSAFIKSLRGSDPDASLYWLARMVYAGEDPRFIFRRMIVLASEDVGLADPQAVVVVTACATAFDRVGMPEGRYPLAHAALYLATCPKSNTVMGFFDALSAVESEKEEDVPLHLRDANRDKYSFGHGKGYLYPHSYREHWVEQQYLPSSLQGQVFYQPSDQGYEQDIQLNVLRRREAQLTALVEGIGVALPEVLTFSPGDRTTERWLQRTLSQVGETLGTVRDRLFAQASLQRHHIVVDLNAGSGLLTWEAVRHVPEGGVYACVRTGKEATALREQAQALPELRRPMVIQSELETLDVELLRVTPNVQCDRLLGRNVLMAHSHKDSVISVLTRLLAPEGKLLLAEAIPRETQRLYQLLSPNTFSKKVYQKIQEAEESIYSNSSDPMVNWEPHDLLGMMTKHGLDATIHIEKTSTATRITRQSLDRWFSEGTERPSYRDYLSQNLSDSDIESIRQAFVQQVENTIVQWQGAIAFIIATRLS
ncbi:MAG: AAA family ATPase [Leptolyngbyaceae bacterium]|nr:AAA family ATPase [Leptolyngbyaceae bacterium]